jgi:transposase-like protein
MIPLACVTQKQRLLNHAQKNTPVTDNPLSYVGYGFPLDVFSYAVWLYYRFPPSLRMVEELLTARY